MAMDAAPEVETRRFTTDDYHRMVEAGILSEDDRVELIDGEIVQMTPIGGPHVWCVGRFARLLTRQLADEAFVLVQSPIQTDQYGEPEPDLAVIKPGREDEGGALPQPEDVLMAIEVADTSLAYDSARKLPLYASVGIPESFLVDLNGNTIERRSDPANGRYRTIQVAGPGERIASTVFPDLVVDVNEILGLR